MPQTSGPTRLTSEASESHVLVNSAFDLARNLGVPNMLVLADLLDDRRAVARARKDESVIWLIRENREDYPDIPNKDACIALPATAMGRFDQVKLGMTLAVLREQIAVDTSVVCVTGLAGSKRLDMVVIINPSRDFPWFRKRTKIAGSPHLMSRSFGRLLEIAVRFASEGREGKSIGTTFVLGDPDALDRYTRPLILNPVKGHPRKVRNIHNPEFLETLRELASLDGAFIVDRRGVVLGAAVYLDARATKRLETPRGVGSRHVAAAAITARTDALAVVISESSSSITVFAKGATLLVLEQTTKG